MKKVRESFLNEIQTIVQKCKNWFFIEFQEITHYCFYWYRSQWIKNNILVSTSIQSILPIAKKRKPVTSKNQWYHNLLNFINFNLKESIHKVKYQPFNHFNNHLLTLHSMTKMSSMGNHKLLKIRIFIDKGYIFIEGKKNRNGSNYPFIKT